MTKQEFYSDLNVALTVSCSLPFSIPDEAIDNIVKYAHKWFVRNYDDAVENIYYLIPKQTWSSNQEFQTTRKLKLPDCIYSVNRVAKDTNSKVTSNQPNLSTQNRNSTNFGLGGETMSNDILGYVIASSYGDLTSQIFDYPISYEYNRHSKKLFLKGSLQMSPDFLLDCDIILPLEDMFDLDLFFDYCLAHSKMQLSNIMGTMQMQLPGDATIDFDRFYTQGKDELDQVKEEVKDIGGGSSFFLHTGSM